jgi:hypothetical protein
VATQEAERVVSSPAASTLYMSRRSELRLVKVPTYPVFGPGGLKVGEQPGLTVEFKDGQFRVPHEGEVILAKGQRIEAGELNTWLQQHPLLHDLEGGFWKVDPVAPPVSQEEMEAITDAALELSEERLRQILTQEQQGWQREQILTTVQRTLDKLEQATAPAEPEPELAPVPPKTKKA